MSRITSLLKDRLNLFYVLAFAPLLLIQYFGYVVRLDFFAALLPLYGFLLVLIKKDKLLGFAEPNRVQRLIGLFLMLTSFVVYYVLVFFYSQAQFYGVTNYALYFAGLFLFSFEASALKEAFAPLFLILAPISGGIAGEWMESVLDPLVPFFAQFIAVVLGVLNIPAELHVPSTFLVETRGGNIVPLCVAAGCIGIHSFVIFVMVAVVTIIEDPTARLRTKLLWSVGGIVGTFFMNLIRVSLIFVVVHYFGFEEWGKIHTPIGYVLFILWLAFFFVVFSKRGSILSGLQTLLRKLR